MLPSFLEAVLAKLIFRHSLVNRIFKWMKMSEIDCKVRKHQMFICEM